MRDAADLNRIIAPQIYRYPALDPLRFRQRVEASLDQPSAPR